MLAEAVQLQRTAENALVISSSPTCTAAILLELLDMIFVPAVFEGSNLKG
jgi:hypothetical protein